MGLSKYIQKRSFSKTPEPSGKKGKTDKGLRFVVQKHAASHLHYDFRLEMEGVLKSWAVPKGPSTDPKVKRLAMMVEDHPYNYRTFEGIIPEGNYGAGTVIVWDKGTYEPIAGPAAGKKETEKRLLAELHAGRLKIVLHGHKLKGEYALVKTSGGEENAWLLIKHNDEYATPADITEEDQSVKSGLTLEEIPGSTFSPKKGKGKSAVKKTKASPIKDGQIQAEDDISTVLRKGKKAAFPSVLKPMLATLTEAPFDSPEWLYEIKWDGYRAVAYLNGKTVEILSRNDLSFTQKFSAVTAALKQLGLKAVLDGEIVAMDDKGHADFQQLQNFVRNGRSAHLVYYVFDVLWLNGKDLTRLPLTERKEILQHILPENDDVVRYSDHITETGTAFFKEATKAGLEGIMAKRMDSLYVPGTRTQNWLKIKNNHRMEAIICGYTEPRNSRSHFGAVVLGRYQRGKLKYIGHSGSGFDARGLKKLYNTFQSLVTEVCPFATVPKTNMPVTWLKPELVCEVKFSEVTDDGILRQPIFLGLREDKTAKDEKKEVKVPPPKNTKPTPRTMKKTEELLPENEKEVEQKIGSQRLTFTNLDKIYFPKEGISKRDVLNYYDSVSEYILPYLVNRPQSLNRHPNGIAKPNFYQKDVKGKVPDWVPTYVYDSDSSDSMEYLVCKGSAELLYMANLGCIEMNPWHSRIQSPEAPDWCVVDLDPDGNPFREVVETALLLKQVLDSVKLPGYCKTSGATGMHIYIPLGAKYTYDDSKALAELLVLLVHRELPRLTGVERMPAKRKGKIYLDFLQNHKIQTIASPYSLRPKPGATVSMPLHWDELRKDLSPQAFNIHNALARIRETGDLFKPVLGKGANLKTAIPKIQGLLGEMS